jgi:hypothetical protein
VLHKALSHFASSGRLSHSQVLAACEAYLNAAAEGRRERRLAEEALLAAEGSAAGGGGSSGSSSSSSSNSRAGGRGSPTLLSGHGNVVTWSGVQQGVTADEAEHESSEAGVGPWTRLRLSPTKAAQMHGSLVRGTSEQPDLIFPAEALLAEKRRSLSPSRQPEHRRLAKPVPPPFGRLW